MHFSQDFRFALVSENFEKKSARHSQKLRQSIGADATFTSVTAGDDIRVTAGGKVTATSLTSNSGADSESDGRNIYVSGSATAIGSATANTGKNAP